MYFKSHGNNVLLLLFWKYFSVKYLNGHSCFPYVNFGCLSFFALLNDYLLFKILIIAYSVNCPSIVFQLVMLGARAVFFCLSIMNNWMMILPLHQFLAKYHIDPLTVNPFFYNNHLFLPSDFILPLSHMFLALPMRCTSQCSQTQPRMKLRTTLGMTNSRVGLIPSLKNELDIIYPTIQNFDILEMWKLFFQPYHLIIVKDTNLTETIKVPGSFDYELYNRHQSDSRS